MKEEICERKTERKGRKLKKKKECSSEFTLGLTMWSVYETFTDKMRKGKKNYHPRKNSEGENKKIKGRERETKVQKRNKKRK